VFQAIVAKLGVDYASVAFNAPGRGHFTMMPTRRFRAHEYRSRRS
jgi:hypothetical protein